MNRRRLLLACLAVVPSMARAQSAIRQYCVGILGAGFNSKSADHPNFPTFFAAMRKLGYVEGSNVRYEIRNADGISARLPQLARELVAANVDVIVVPGSSEAVAAFRATASIPIVMIHAADPVELGLAVSLARPGRNVTGLTSKGVGAKALDLLLEALPKAKRIAVLANTEATRYAGVRKEMEELAAGKQVSLYATAEVKRPKDFDVAFARISKDRPDAMVVIQDAIMFFNRRRIVDFASHARIPTMYGFTEDVEAGGLMAFSSPYRPLYARAPEFVDKILKGANPGELPIEEPLQFGLWINMKTAQALGLTFPPSILARADRVIE